MYSSTSKPRRRRSRLRRRPAARRTGSARTAAGGGALVSMRLTIWPSSPRRRSCGGFIRPRSASSTVSSSGMCTTTRSRSWISMSTSNVGGALRSSTLFCVPRRRASSSLEGHGLDAAEQVVEGGVDQQVVEVGAVRGADQLHAALGDGARRHRLQLGADLVDDDDLRHVVLDRLDHHRVLLRRGAHLHAPRAADAGVRDVAVAADLVAGVDDDHALAALVAEHARALAQHRGLADPGRAEQQDRLAVDDDVLDDVDGAGDRAADAAGEARRPCRRGCGSR